MPLYRPLGLVAGDALSRAVAGMAPALNPAARAPAAPLDAPVLAPASALGGAQFRRSLRGSDLVENVALDVEPGDGLTVTLSQQTAGDIRRPHQIRVLADFGAGFVSVGRAIVWPTFPAAEFFAVPASLGAFPPAPALNGSKIALLASAPGARAWALQVYQPNQISYELGASTSPDAFSTSACVLDHYDITPSWISHFTGKIPGSLQGLLTYNHASATGRLLDLSALSTFGVEVYLQLHQVGAGNAIAAAQVPMLETRLAPGGTSGWDFQREPIVPELPGFGLAVGTSSTSGTFTALNVGGLVSVSARRELFYP